jgi:thiol-disulfide isomerase/thioredoxin
LQHSYRHNAVNLHAAKALWTDPRWDFAAEDRTEKGGNQEQSILDPRTLEKARKHALLAAKRAARSGTLARLEAARSVFVAAGQEETAAALAVRLKGLDELWKDQDSRGGPRSRARINKAIRAASRKYNPEQRLSGLNAIEGELGNDDTARATWLRARSGVLMELNRVNEATDDLATAYSLTPGNASLANEFAWRSGLAGLRLKEALAASESAITAVRAEIWRPIEARLWPGGFKEWSKAQLRNEASYIDTRAWILYKMGRYEDAAESQREALRLLPDAELHLHMGLIYSKLDRPHDAVGHLSRGLRNNSGGDDPIEKEGREIFEQLFSHAGLWHPGGPGAYLTLVEEQREAREEADKKAEPTIASAERREKFAAGAPFPDLSYRVGEVEQSLSSIGSLLLVDLWATWCGPCIKGMPHLDEVARNYKKHGLVTLALSVDAEQQEALVFFDGENDLAFLQGWTGRDAMKTVGIRGIPSIFILDEDLQILGYVSGYMDEDRRIEEILDTHLHLDN